MATLLVAWQRQKDQFSCSHSTRVCLVRALVACVGSMELCFWICARVPHVSKCEFQKCQTHNEDRNWTTDAI